MEANHRSEAAAASPPAPPRAPLGELDVVNNEFPQPGATTIAGVLRNHHHHCFLWTIHSLKIPGSKDAILNLIYHSFLFAGFKGLTVNCCKFIKPNSQFHLHFSSPFQASMQPCQTQKTNGQFLSSAR